MFLEKKLTNLFFKWKQIASIIKKKGYLLLIFIT